MTSFNNLLKSILKTVKRGLLINLYFLGDVISRVIYFYSLLKNYTYVVVREDRYGHQIGTLDCELYLACERKKISNIDTIFLLTETRENLANTYLRNISPSIIKKFGFDSIVIDSNSSLKLIQRFLKNYISENKRFYRSSTTLSPHLKAPLFDRENTDDKILKKLSIKKEKYLCIYSRDSKYLNERFPKSNWNYHNHRNSDIDNLADLAKYASDQLNTEVVRVGSNVRKPINWTRNIFPKIIDYSVSQYLSEKNDIDLIASCSIYISNGGGPETVAIAARREMIRINQTPILEEIGYDFGIYLPMIIRRKSNKKIISIREAISLGISDSYSSCDYGDIDLYIEENQSTEILNAFKDYIKYKNNSFNLKENLVINEYKKLRKENEKKGLILEGFNNFIAPSFLLKYPELLN